MPKMKTKKALSKKVRITKNQKAFCRSTGQNHFNAKENGVAGRNKKRDRRLFKTDEKNVIKAMQI